MANFLNDEMIARSVANEGDTGRLAALLERARAGEKLTLAFLGGSITQGCLSSTPKTCYSYLVYEWFVRRFPKSEFTYVNAGIGGTTSQFGAARLDEDVLSYKPDLCMVEFSVNDSDNIFFRETYESVVSRLLESETAPAVMILHNLFYEDGHNAQKQHLQVGKAYRVPCVSVRDAVYPEITAGNIKTEQLSSDGLHPNDDGHALLAGLVCDMLEKILAEAGTAEAISGTEGSAEKIPASSEMTENAPHRRRITPDAYCTVRRIQNKAEGVILKGFVPDYTPKEDIRDIFKCGWKASKVGEEIELSFSGTELAVQYRKTINRPAPVAVAVIDGDEEHPVKLDANFDQDWGDSLHMDTLLWHGHRVDPAGIYGDFETMPAAGNGDSTENDDKRIEKSCMPVGKHNIRIRIVETHEDDKETFYLVSFIVG